MAEPTSTLLLGLMTGFLFGFLLQKGQVTKFSVIVGQFLLRDFTVIKTMLTAIVVGGIGIYALKSAGLATLHVKPAQMAAVIIGGAMFGVGMVLLGYCPGTGLAAAAEGHRDAAFGVLGMLLGAAIFAEIHATVSKTVLTWFNLGPVTIPEVLSIPVWVVLSVLVVCALALFAAIERHQRVI